MRRFSLTAATMLCLVFCFLRPVLAKPLSDARVIFSHDGNIDDISALALLLGYDPTRVKAVTVLPADSFLGPAIGSTKFVLDYMGAKGVEVSIGDESGVNPFPDLFRQDSVSAHSIFKALQIPNEASNRIVPLKAAQHLVSLLSGDEKFVLIHTGPLTSLAQALKLRPEIKRNIVHAYIMGGSVYASGNVHDRVAGTVKAAEWNFHNDPQSAADVISSGIKIYQIGLDATNSLPFSQQGFDLFKQKFSRRSQPIITLWERALANIGNDNLYY